MALSPAHKFGQIIGDILESATAPILKKFAESHDLYFDKKGPRLARSGLKVSWTDLNGNSHDLDYVLERGGSEEKIGNPIAFIESAWRRYTKHSRNKAQEIQGAIIPLAQKYSDNKPFTGVILAGVFTEGAIQQLKSLGFTVLFFSYDMVVSAFEVVGIDASFDEETTLTHFKEKIKLWEALSDEQKVLISTTLIELNKQAVNDFLKAILKTITRNIVSIRILPLHGKIFEYQNIQEAKNFISNYNEQGNGEAVARYEVNIKYNNDDEIRGNFLNKADALAFLQSYEI